ncbi:TPA: hypothetical protein ACKTGI_002749 [Pseudomonas aeruginosa]
MNTSIDKLLTMLNTNKFEEKVFLATIAATEHVEIKEHACESLRAIFSLLKERKKHDEKNKKIKKVESEAELIKRINKELLETDTTYRNLSKIIKNIATYQSFSEYCKSNNIRNPETRLSETKQKESIKSTSRANNKNS